MARVLYDSRLYSDAFFMIFPVSVLKQFCMASVATDAVFDQAVYWGELAVGAVSA